MGKIKHPNVVEPSKMVLNAAQQNLTADDLKSIITDLCKKASDTNTMQLVTIYFLNDASTKPEKRNTIGTVQLPIFPHTFNIDDNIFKYSKRIYTEADLISEDLGLDNYHASAFGKPVSLIFSEYPDLLTNWLVDLNDDNLNKIRECKSRMREIAKTQFPDKTEAVEHYIKTCFNKTIEMVEFFKHFTMSCNGKKDYTGPVEPLAKFDTVQVQRLLNHIYNNFNAMYYIASEWCHETDENALKAYKIYGPAENFFMTTSIPNELKVYDSAFKITTNVLEMAGIENTLKNQQPGDDEN